MMCAPFFMDASASMPLGGVVYSKGILVDKQSIVFGQCFGGFLVYIAIEYMPLVVGQPYVSCIDVGGKALLAICLVQGREHFDTIHNPVVRHLGTYVHLRYGTVIPLVLWFGCICDGVSVFDLE